MVKLTIIIPIYNSYRYLKRCLDSIRQQTFTDFSVLLMDDGSTDGSGKICDEYAKSDKRFVVCHLKNGGPANARNEGLKIASSEWVTFVDSDDYIEPWAFERMINNSINADMVVSGRIIEYENKAKNITFDEKFLKSDNPIKLYIECEFTNSRDYIWNRLYKLSIIKENGISFYDIRTGEDTLFNIDYHLHINSVKTISCAYYHYIQSGNSLSKGYKSTLIEFHDLLNDKWKYMLENGNLDGNEKTIIYSIICGTFYSEISNLFFTKNQMSFLRKRSLYLNRFRDNTFVYSCLLKQKTFHSINNRIMSFLYLHKLFNTSVIYAYIISIIKTLKSD